MTKRKARRLAAALAGILLPALALADPATVPLRIQSAEPLSSETVRTQTVLAATRAEARVVAVGSRGLVALSDDDGATLRQAHEVPVQASLTSVSFVDGKSGWAAGHWGTILTTADGGETWRLQRSDLAVDRPLFAIHFFNRDDGVAVGLWSLILVTRDGGATWRERPPPAPPGSTKADLSLYSLFTDAAGTLFATAEGGKLLRSADRGDSWSYVETGYKGTFWTGTVLKDGTLLVGGLRGSIYRSTDGGRQWQAAAAESRSSVTGLAQLADGSVAATALDGVSLTSSDGGATFKSSQREDRLALTALLPASGGGALIFSRQGIPAP